MALWKLSNILREAPAKSHFLRHILVYFFHWAARQIVHGYMSVCRVSKRETNSQSTSINHILSQFSHHVWWVGSNFRMLVIIQTIRVSSSFSTHTCQINQSFIIFTKKKKKIAVSNSEHLQTERSPTWLLLHFCLKK